MIVDKLLVEVKRCTVWKPEGLCKHVGVLRFALVENGLDNDCREMAWC